MTRTVLLVGTRKGAFILDGGANRRDWTVSEPLCEGWPIHDLQWDPTTRSIGPVLREEINVFVDGEQAALDTILPPGATVHVIPAVSGG